MAQTVKQLKKSFPKDGVHFHYYSVSKNDFIRFWRMSEEEIETKINNQTVIDFHTTKLKNGDTEVEIILK